MNSSKRLRVLICAGLPLLMTGVITHAAETSDSVPEPLTLDYALALADEAHPDIGLAQASLDMAAAQQLQAQSNDDLSVSLDARVRLVDPSPVLADKRTDDHHLGVYVQKRLYDFGYQSALEDVAIKELEGHQHTYLITRQQRRLDIMRRYFDVVTADLEFFRYNEEMAVAFIAFDRTRDRKKIGQASDFDVLEKEREYQRIRHLRFRSQNEQRRTRALLAIVMNRPGKLANTVSVPKLSMLEDKLPEYETIIADIQKVNPQLKAMQSRLDAALARVEMARNSDNPVIKAEFEAHQYSRVLGSSDIWRAGIKLEMPLYDGDRSKASLARAQAELYRTRMQYEDLSQAVKQQALELWLELDGLRSKRDEMHALNSFRELYLDRSRAYYELELKTDLGDAMVRVTEAQREAALVDFRIALAWGKLDALLGRLPALNRDAWKETQQTNSDAGESL